MAKVLFIQKTYLEMFGVMSLAAVLRARGHEVRVSLERGARLLRDVAEWSPDVAAFTAVSMNAHNNLRDAASVHAAHPDIPIIFGGVHPTFFPDMIDHPQVDAICRGEGEDALVEYTEAVAGGADPAGILNLWIKTNGQTQRNSPLPLTDLDALPFPDRSVYYDRYPFLRNNPAKNFLASRGCPYNCSFCFNKTYRKMYRESGHKASPHQRSPENMIAEILDFKARYPLEKLAFQDENFCLNKPWLFAFLDLYREKVGLPFFCMINASVADGEIVAALKRAGCHQTTFGVESGDQALRRELMKKPVADEQIRRTAALLHSHGITFHTTNILGFPGDTVDTALKTMTFNAEIAPTSTVAFIYMPFANLELTDLAVAKGWLTAAQTQDWERLQRIRVRIPDYRRIARLRLLFGIGVRRPRLIPAIKAVSLLPIGIPLQILFIMHGAWNYFIRNRQNVRYMFMNFYNLRKLYKSYWRE